MTHNMYLLSGTLKSVLIFAARADSPAITHLWIVWLTESPTNGCKVSFSSWAWSCNRLIDSVIAYADQSVGEDL